jgi:hypothetical protein
MIEPIETKLDTNKAGIWETFEAGDLSGLKLMDVTGKTLHMLFCIDSDRKIYQEFTKAELEELYAKNRQDDNEDPEPAIG